MKAIFYAAGPDFKERRLSNVDNIDVALTIADALGIKPPFEIRLLQPVGIGNLA